MLKKLMIYRYLLLIGLFLGGLSVAVAQDAAEGGGEAAAESSGAADPAAGETLFLNNCAQCHARDMRQDLTGPALGEVESRWESQEDLYAWIRNSQALIAEGHPRATELWDEWKPTVMPSYTNFTDQDMANILAYINQQYIASGQTAEVAGGDGVSAAAEKEDNTLLFIILLVILSVLAVVLARIISNLNYMSQVREGTAPAKRRTLVDILTSRGVIGFVIFALVVLGGYTTVNNAIELGRQQGYQPEQPIKFNHAVHAGQYEIDCQYCHDGARRSKHSVIPATNTCMNCHRAIKVGSQYGTAELTKIYASIGYDPSSDTYFSADSVSTEEMEEIYKKWIADNYVQETGGLDDEGERIINEQWDGIVASLTSEDDPDIMGPIEWVRIHNLPDHVYFNHAQHVSVGQVECQTCHGQIQEMEVVAQHSPLSMGWCINCHRQTEVAQFEDNDYYKAYERYHEELSEGERDNVTVEDIGGLGCQKCHY